MYSDSPSKKFWKSAVNSNGSLEITGKNAFIRKNACLKCLVVKEVLTEEIRAGEIMEI